MLGRSHLVCRFADTICELAVVFSILLASFNKIIHYFFHANRRSEIIQITTKLYVTFAHENIPSSPDLVILVRGLMIFARVTLSFSQMKAIAPSSTFNAAAKHPLLWRWCLREKAIGPAHAANLEVEVAAAGELPTQREKEQQGKQFEHQQRQQQRHGKSRSPHGSPSKSRGRRHRSSYSSSVGPALPSIGEHNAEETTGHQHEELGSVVRSEPQLEGGGSSGWNFESKEEETETGGAGSMADL